MMPFNTALRICAMNENLPPEVLEAIRHRVNYMNNALAEKRNRTEQDRLAILAVILPDEELTAQQIAERKPVWCCNACEVGALLRKAVADGRVNRRVEEYQLEVYGKHGLQTITAKRSFYSLP